MIINDDINPNAAMPTSNDEESNDIMIMSSNVTATSRFSDDEEDDDDETRLTSQRMLNPNFDDDDDDDEVLMISDETKVSVDTYNTSIIRSSFPFDRFRSYINDHIQQLALSYSISTNRNKSLLLTQIYKKIISESSTKRPLILHIQANDLPGPINSYAMNKFEKTSEKFQARLLTLFNEQTIINGLLCLWLLKDSFQNRLLPSVRVTQNK